MVCDAKVGSCGPQFQETACSRDEECQTGLCDPSRGCVPCSQDSECPSGLCELYIGNCVGALRANGSSCLDDKDCASKLCDYETSVCIGKPLPSGSPCGADETITGDGRCPTPKHGRAGKRRAGSTGLGCRRRDDELQPSPSLATRKCSRSETGRKSHAPAGRERAWRVDGMGGC